MVEISAHFSTPDFADFSIGQLKGTIEIENVSIESYGSSDNDYSVTYPLKPEYLEPSHTQYLEGMPHVLSNGPIFNQYFEPEHKSDAILKFKTSEAASQKALNILLKFGAYDVSVKNEC